jgi:hypothetical protein
MRMLDTAGECQSDSAASAGAAARASNWHARLRSVALVAGALGSCVAASSGRPAAQRFTVVTAGGTTHRGEVVSCERDRLGLSVVDPAGKPATLALSFAEVLSLHLAVPKRAGPVEAHLVGGDLIAGELRGGDGAGETFELRSPTLGTLTIPVDRLDVLVFRDRAGDALATDFRVPAGSDHDEALFVRARVGFDAMVGAIHRFGEREVSFQTGGVADEAVVPPHPVRYDALAAIALRGGVPRPRPAGAHLLTRSGDLVSVDVLGLSGKRFRFLLEGAREVAVAFEDIASLTFLAAGRVYLSDLDPVEVDESSYFGEGGEPLLPWTRDRNVSGGYLVSGGIAHGKGVGAHSRSVLRWRVPEGVRHFTAAVGLDDEVLALPVRGDVRIAVLLDDTQLAALDSLRSGAPPRELGLLDVRPGALLTLEVDFGRGLDLGDRVDWLGAVFLP